MTEHTDSMEGLKAETFEAYAAEHGAMYHVSIKSAKNKIF